MKDVGDLALAPMPDDGGPADETPIGELAEWLRLPCFPVLPTKAPATPRGFKDATSDPDAIRALWKRYPAPLIGVATGAVSGIDVLDLDVKSGGMDWFQDWHDRLPETRVHRTRSGGLHVLFKHLPGLRNSTSKIANGVDVRADGGYIVWWPMERFQARGSLDALGQWPLWLWPSLMGTPKPLAPPYAKAAAPARPATLAAIEGLIRTVATAPRGQRNSIVFWAAHRMRESVAEGTISATDGRDHLLEAARAAGLSEIEATRTVASAWRGARRG